MRRLLALAGLAGVVVWLRRRDRGPATRATVGYTDGSSIVLEPGSPELDALEATAREALAG